MKNVKIILFITLLMIIPKEITSQTIITTKHNLSISSPGTIKATSESEICIFCHSPHKSRPRAPLWNKNIAGTNYILYNSSTFDATQGQPDGSSILCLSCHDGTIALGEIASRPFPIEMTGQLAGESNLTTDLSNDHPVSFVYDALLATTDGQLKTPPLPTIELDNNSKLQCTSCHDPHKDVYSNFLITTNEFSNLCFICHDRTYWDNSTHNTSINTWNGTGANPWSHLESAYLNVSQNGCENCHDTHNAKGNKRLMKALTEEDNCLDCHNGNVALKDVQADITKTYRHDVYGYTNIHNPIEDVLSNTKHVECQDCHNPHASNETTSTAPYLKGYNKGVNGINQSGNIVNPANYEYEMCYKCHSDSFWTPVSAFPRLINENNSRLEFDVSNPSFHPVVGARNNSEVSANLIYPNTISTILYCSDCHASDNSDVSGPHGSIYPYILKNQYLTDDYTVESPTAYQLCYSCHNRSNIINDNNTFPEHKKHIVKEDTPCSVCHDPHGISSMQGSTFNNSNLINFRTDIVFPSSSGLLKFEDTGVRSGRCYLTCHGEDHDPESY